MYIGTTVRGRKVREDSLQQCVESLAYIMRQQPEDPNLIIVQAPKAPGVWYVYDNQAAANADRFDDAFALGRFRWVAIIESGAW